MEGDAAKAELLVERCDLIDRDRRREQILASAARAVDNGNIDVAEIERRTIAHHLAIEWGFAVSEPNGKAELLREEGAGSVEIGDEELRLGGREAGA